MAASSSRPKEMPKDDLLYLFNHIFLPPKLPQSNDTSAEHDLALCRAVLNASLKFSQFISPGAQAEWNLVVVMLKKLFETTQALDKDTFAQNILRLGEKESLVFHVRAQNAAVIIRRKQAEMIFEAFEVAPRPQAVMSTKRKLARSYPGPAVQIPLEVAQNPSFAQQLASCLIQMDVDDLDAGQNKNTPSTFPAMQGNIDPRFITQFLMRTLQGMGEATDAVKHITKRIADEINYDGTKPWHRSGLWLILRTAIELSVEKRETYKAFMIFLQTELLGFAFDYGLSSELIHVARVKMGRRIFKLGDAISTRISRAFQKACGSFALKAQIKWEDEQLTHAKPLRYVHDLKGVEMARDIELKKSRQYLKNVMTAVVAPDPIEAFVPSHSPRLRDCDNFAVLADEGMSKAITAEPFLALADFEWLVQERLDGWVTENSHDRKICRTLGSCLTQYYKAAKVRYMGSPESESIMLLTIMELWVGLDKVALRHCDLMKSYSPDIPPDFLHPLLLRQAKSIERAWEIEMYLHRRRSEATIPISIFSAEMEEMSFAVQYYQRSTQLQALKAAIEGEATQDREGKKEELKKKNEMHKDLMAQYAHRHCDYREHEGEFHHLHQSCARCKLKRQAKALTIDVHEWPLPTGQPYATEAVVFELKCPVVFAIWRKHTYKILRDIGMAYVPSQSKFSPEITLEDYDGLERWSRVGTSGRLTLGLNAKQFQRRHYNIPAEEKDICLDHGVKWRLFDSEGCENLVQTFDVRLDAYCTFRIPDKSLYKHLQYAVTHTTHTHNETLVNQADCPRNLSLHEHLAYSNVRSGPLLQWLNILREIRANTLTFSREEVHMLLMQAAWQIGPLGSADGTEWGREWHHELEVPDFGVRLVEELQNLLEKVEANWMEGVTVRNIIYLITRLLASIVDKEEHEQVRQAAYRLLLRARVVTQGWMRELTAKLQAVVDDDKVKELQQRACEMAATCRATFDVDPGVHLTAMLSSSSDVAVLIECSIVVHDNAPAQSQRQRMAKTHPDFLKLHRRDFRLSHALQPDILAIIREDSSGLNKAIASVWSGYRPGGDSGEAQWKQLSSPNGRWLIAHTQETDERRAQQLHFNLLNGKLLVDGKPLGRLSKEIIDHAMYKRIFGQKILDVIPADMDGMDFASRMLIHGHKTFFTLRDDNKTLIIRALTLAGQLFELIPPSVFLKDLPTFFATEYVHWMDMSTGEIEFRPLEKLWEQSVCNWRLYFSADERVARMTYGTASKNKGNLLDIRSDAFRHIARMIQPLEVEEHLTVVYDARFGSTSVELPRFRLSFFVNEHGLLESRNFQGMVIDTNQASGTMIGLKTQLILCPKDQISATLPRSRCVLIPHGTPSSTFNEDQNHVRVHINTTGDHFQRWVKWYKYNIDEDLGCLSESANLTSRLYRIYLHALCSHPLPDPLTSQTGTEHALQELKNAACFSFQRLTDADVKLLHLIGNLTPRRSYNPKGAQAMQLTKWASHLPALAQHGGLDPAVSKIMEYARSLSLLNDLKDIAGVELEYKSSTDPILMERALERNAIYYETVHSDSPDSPDQKYEARDSPHSDAYNLEGSEAMKTSRLVFAWPLGSTQRPESANEIINTFVRWGYIRGPSNDTSLAYNHDWRHVDLRSGWLTLYSLCRKLGNNESKKFRLLFLFSFLAYCKPEFQKYIPLFLSVATMDNAFPAPPTQSHLLYNLSDGFEPTADLVRNMVFEGTRDLSDSPAADLAKFEGETDEVWHIRQNKYYKDTTRGMIKSTVVHLMNQSGSSNPRPPSAPADVSDWFQMKKIMDKVVPYFNSCACNAALHEFALRVTAVLQANYMACSLTNMEIPSFSVPGPLVGAVRLPASHFSLQNLLLARVKYSEAPNLMEHEFGAGSPVFENLQGPGNQGVGVDDPSNLKTLLDQFKCNTTSALIPRYCERLEESRLRLQQQDDQLISALPENLPPDANNTCIEYRDTCSDYLKATLSEISSALLPKTDIDHVLKDSGLWPRIHPRSLLYLLAPASGISLVDDWKTAWLTYASAFIEYQHAQRLVAFSLHDEVDEFYKELRNARFDRKEAEEHPDWILIQIEGNFIIRKIQSNVAQEMIRPSSARNTLLQLNMGEGKSHIIVPIVASALADSVKLVRVVVLKPLATQMFHLLVERISGLTNRRVFYLPFSRDVKMDPTQVDSIESLLDECARVRGVLVTQPEHILSFRLMVIDRILMSGSPLDDVAQGLYNLQDQLRSITRDILDESDELLHVRYQLIYTMSEQQHLEDSPDRWLTIQKVLDLVCRHVQDIQEDYPDDVELSELHEEETAAGAFTHTRLLQKDAARRLAELIAEDAVNGEIETLNITGLIPHPRIRASLLDFLQDRHVSVEAYSLVESHYKGSGLWKGLLLLRGLLGYGILHYVLGRQRWRVDYGLDLKRSLLAVPYRAKDMPSLRSEFGHPDVCDRRDLSGVSN